MVGLQTRGKWCAWLTAGLLLLGCEETPLPIPSPAAGGSLSTGGSAGSAGDAHDPALWRWSICGRVPNQEAPLQLAFGAAQDNLLVFLQSGKVLDAPVSLV